MNPAVQRALNVASSRTGFAIRTIIGQCRESRIVEARRLAARLMRTEGLSFPKIGQALGGRHHTTAMALCRGYEGEQLALAFDQG